MYKGLQIVLLSKSVGAPFPSLGALSGHDGFTEPRMPQGLAGETATGTLLEASLHCGLAPDSALGHVQPARRSWPLTLSAAFA